MHAPDREHVRGVAAADVDHVLARHVLRRSLGHAEQRHVARLAVARRELLVEADDPLGLLAARRRQVADARPARSGETEQEILDPGIAAEQGAAAHREDVSAHAASVDSPRHALRLRLRRGDDRRPGAPRRQGDRARGDDRARRPRSGRLHDHDRRLPRLHGGRQHASRTGSTPRWPSTSPRSRARPASASATPDDPLLVSVRSGAAVSMPGMMDTILNLGLNDDAVAGLAKATGNPRFAYDSYRRLIQMYGEVVEGVEGYRFEQALTDLKSERGVEAGHRPRRLRSRRADRDLQADLRGRDRRAVPAGRARPARARRPRRLRLLELTARAGLPAHLRDPRRHRHRRQRRPDGLREQGRHLRDGRLLHPRPLDRREPALRRVPPERAGRGRRRGDPDARADRADERAPARGLRAAARDDRAARGALPRHAGHRVHRRGERRSTSSRRARRSGRPRRRCARRSRWSRRG